MLQELGSKLRQLPDKIATAQESVWVYSNVVERYQEELRVVEAEIRVDIAKELDGAKPKFSNEIAREAEFNRRKVLDQNWKDRHGCMSKSRDSFSKLKVEAEKLSNEFSATKHLANLYAAWMKTQDA